MHWNTLTPSLREILKSLMKDPAFQSFRLVGGTSLSLQLGHRQSVDIDMFTDAAYDSIDFETINNYFKTKYAYVDSNRVAAIGFGSSYIVGHSEDQSVKIDIYYTDPFIRPLLEEEKIRMARMEDIVAMKLDIIGRGGRKKDFWDLHELQSHFDIPTMLELYQERYPYGQPREKIQKGFINFKNADDDFDPICLLGKHWELIKLDFIQWMKKVS